MKTRLLFLLLFVSSYTFAQIPNNVARYEFTNGNLTNLEDPGNGNLGGGAVPANLLRTDRFGVANNAIRANAITRNGYTFTGTNNNLSISFWVKGSGPTAGNQRIFQIAAPNGDVMSMRTGPSSTLITRFKNGSGSSNDNQSSQAGLSIFNGGWHHIVYIVEKLNSGYDNSVYIDGVLHTTLSGNIDSSNTTNFLVGNSVFVLSPINYHGEIDDILLFDRAITPIEVAHLFDGTALDSGVKYYVDNTANGANDGSSWNDAYTNLQDAIDAYTTGAIWVKEGTYYPSAYAVGSQQGTRDQTFLIAKEVKIYGGFDGTETVLSERNVTTNPTILTGDFNNDDNVTITTTEPTRQDNAIHVVTVKGDFLRQAVLDGFTISGGNANSTAFDLNCATSQTQQYDKRRGAAIFTDPDSAGRNVSIKLSNCIIENNSAIGMAVSYSMNPCGANTTITDIDFENTIIRGNYSIDYANIFYGASAYGIKRYGSLINCLIYNNETTNQASVMQISANGSHKANLNVQIINTTIANNISGTNKFAKFSQAQKLNLFNNIIYNNGSNNTIDLIGAAPTASHNIIQSGQLSGSTSNPLFTDAANNDFTLQSGSPAIDAGDNNLIPAGIVADLLQNDRIFNTTVDMGCYEYGSSPVAAVNELTTNLDFTLYPNPVNNTLNIALDTAISNVAIYNLQGQKVKESTTEQVNVATLSQGIYLIKIEDENGNTAMKKFIKK